MSFFFMYVKKEVGGNEIKSNQNQSFLVISKTYSNRK